MEQLILDNVDQALEKLKLFNQQSFSKLDINEINEATTRFRIIDDLFIGVLGWPKNLLEVECEIGETADDNRHKSIYADYMAVSNYNQFIIEAKRSGSYFNIPQGRGRVYKSSGSIYNSENKAFIDQAKKYMLKFGTPFCVLTNGYQFIIIRRPAPNLERDTIVFRDLKDIELHFSLFWSILNPHADGPSILDNALKNTGQIRQAPPFNRRISEKIKNTEKYSLAKHSAIVAIEVHLNRFFGELVSKSQLDLLKQCYCDPSGSYKDFAGVIKKRLEPQPITAITPLGGKDFLTKSNFEKQYIENLKTNPGAVYVLLGEVGAGKSTFLEHFYNFELSDFDRNKIIWIRIDFLKYNKSLDHLDDFISDEIIDRIESTEYGYLALNEWETLEKIYEKEVLKFKAGIPPSLRNNLEFTEMQIYTHIQQYHQQKEFRLKKTLEYIKSVKALNVCFVFDNIDQKPFDEQKEVLLMAHQRADSYGSTVITAMRYQSYNMIKNKAPFDALQTYEYRIQPPSVKNILDKRFEALQKYPQTHYIYEHGTKTVKIPIVKFVKILKNTFEKDPDAKVERLFESLSNGNIRKLLKLFRAMVTSGNTRLHELLDIITEISNIENTHLSYTQVLDGITRDNNKFYSSEESEIINLFKFEEDGFYSHFLVIYILKYLESKLLYRDKSMGYVDINDILDTFSSVINNRDRLDTILTPLLVNSLINSDVGARDTIVGTNAVQISDAGLYYINTLMPNWRYIYNVMIDTPLRDNAVFDQLNSKFQKIQPVHNRNRKLDLSYECVEIFMNYLEEIESQDLKYFSEDFPIKPIVNSLKNDVNASYLSDKKSGTR